MGSDIQNPPEMVQLGGEEVSGGFSAAMHPERVARLGDCKKRSLVMGRYIQQEGRGLEPLPAKLYLELACDVLSCANYLVFHNYFTIDQVRLAKITTCKKHMLCPVCARIRAAKQVQKYLERFNVLKSFSKIKIKLALLTLTVKNGEDLQERFEHLKKSWQNYQKKRRQFKNTNRGFNQLCKVEGAVFSYEITNKGQGWHPHLHAVVILSDRIDQDLLSQEWLGITGDSFICDIRMIKGDPSEGFLEVFKYALKFSELSLQHNLEAYFTLKGKRLQGSFGEFHGVEIPDSMTDDPLFDLPYLELFYKYRASGCYSLETCKEKPPVSTLPTGTKCP